MKASELRIGNFVQHDLSKGTDKFDAVKASCFAKDYYLKEYNAIPLTEEWILKFGFKDYDNTDITLYLEKILKCQLAYRILYVHQLQNLFFTLTAKELKLK
ncbi:MAG: hypothetical protein V4549_06595 [Bacteroidota bacterium]